MIKQENFAPVVLLVGNPNTGKTSLVNRATNSALHIGNWHGVTIGATLRSLAIPAPVSALVDLAGTYSLAPFSLEETTTSDFVAVVGAPILNICEQNNLRRNLLLTLQLLELNLPVTLLVNKFGKSTKTSALFNIEKLTSELKINVSVIDFFSSEEIKNFFKNYIPEMCAGAKNNFNYLNDFPIEKIKRIIIKNNLLNVDLINSTFENCNKIFVNIKNNNCKNKNILNCKNNNSCNENNKCTLNKKCVNNNCENNNCGKNICKLNNVCELKGEYNCVHCANNFENNINNSKKYINNLEINENLLNFIALRLIEGDDRFLVKASKNAELNNILSACDYQEKLYNARYKYIDELLKKCDYKLHLHCKNNYELSGNVFTNNNCEIKDNKLLNKNNKINNCKNNNINNDDYIINNNDKINNNNLIENNKNNIIIHKKNNKNIHLNNSKNNENFGVKNSAKKITEKNIAQKNSDKTQKNAKKTSFFNKNAVKNKNAPKSQTQKLDKILLNKYLAIPIFACIMLLVFYLTFSSVGAYISSVFEFIIVEVIGAPILFFIEYNLGRGFVYSLVSDGILGGVGSVVAFLPQVMLLFFFLTAFEESGYMARLAYLMEGIFCKVGLSGKSVFTFLMGFGCTATAIMTAENLNNKTEKIKTILTTPYMACSAKLPVFAVIGGAFFAQGNVLVIFLLYVLSALLGILIANVLDKTALKTRDSSFILEFPPYRIPRARVLWSSLKRNTCQFLTRIGGYIFCFSIIIWLLQSFTLSLEFVGTADAEQSKSSILQSAAQLLAPLFAPLGFGEWGAVSALLAGVIAKELIVSSIGIINNVSASNALVGASLTLPTSAICFTQSSALAFLTFCLLYTPCIATISAMRAEVGAKWTAISVALQLAVAYVAAFAVYKIASLIALYGWLLGAAVLAAITIICYATVKCVAYFTRPKDCQSCPYKG